MGRCSRCGGRLRRVHRTFQERFTHMAMFECRDCRAIEPAPRRYMHHFGDKCRCPRCGTYRVSRLKEPDRIDPMETGVLNLLERLAGDGKLYHCRFCRVQFYDRRLLASEVDAAADAEQEAAAPPGSAGPGA